MPLSAQGVLEMVGKQQRLCEVFDHVSLTNAPTATAASAADTASPPSRVLCGSVVRPEAGGGSGEHAVAPARGDAAKGVVRIIPTATVVVRSPPAPSALAATPSPSPSSSPGDVVVGRVSSQGTLYVCELPERTWASIGAVTATSAPLQRQLAFTTEASAFGGSHNASFAYGGGGPDGESPVLARPPATLTTVLSAITHADGAEELLSELRGLGVVTDGSASFSAGGHAGGIQLPGLTSPTDNGNAEAFPVLGTSAPPRHASAASSPHTTALGAAHSMSGTVTFLLWVAADATTSAVAATASAAAPTGKVVHASHRDPLSLTREGTASGGGGVASSSLPGCVCFAVRDVGDAKSNDTELLTSRDRRVQMLTLQLASGAAAYRTKSAADVFVLCGSGGSSSGSADLSPVAAHGNASSSSAAASSRGRVTFSFVFHQGGISRCVAALRRQSPGLAYARLGGRTNSSVLFSSDGSHTGTAGAHAAPTLPNRSPGGGPSMNSSVTGSDSSTRHHPTKAERHGLRERLAAGAWFLAGGSASSGSSGAVTNVGGLLSHHTSNLRAEAVQVGDGGGGRHHDGKSGNKQPAAHKAKDKGGKSGGTAGTGDSPSSRRDRSSNSSFEDLTEEMTAIRLGPCYAPPRPSLPPLPAKRDAVHARGVGAVSAVPSPVSAKEWEEVFAGHPNFTQSPARPPRASPVSEHFPESDPATSASSVSMAAILADRAVDPGRWRAFRQAVYERGGLADNSIRYEVWCYLLGAYAVGSSSAERAVVLRGEEALYARLTTQWKSFLPEQEANFAAYRYAKHFIIKDVERTDRTHPAFREDDSAMLRVLQELLLGHVMLDMDLGYSQGMSDVAAIAILVTPPSSSPPAMHPSPAAEAAMFLCYRKILSEHMSTNFIIEERKPSAPYAAVKGLQRKLYQVQVLARHFHPGLYKHLKAHCMAEDMSFCFRWMLVCFKRDLPSIADTMRFWDVLFACPYTKSYEVIVTVALLGALAPQIITHIHAYETLLQFFNTLNTSTTLDQILLCAREFYEDVCVAETRELRRQAAAEAAGAAAAAAIARGEAVGEALPGWYVGPHGKASVPAGEASSATKAEACTDAADNRYPTVEEMVLLFLKTDGPL